jgi:hypothetical protein
MRNARRFTMPGRRALGAWALATGSVALAGCGAADAEAAGSMPGKGGDGAAADAGAAAGDGPTGPEDETERLRFGDPAVGATHVWVTSRENDLVLRIDARTRAVDAITVGDDPTVVVTLAGRERAVVLNRGSDELAFVDAQGESPEVAFVRLERHFNALALSPDGRFGIAWFDLGAAETGEDATALQDAAIIDVEARTARSISTGFRPRAPVFSNDGRRCFVVTEDGVSVVELDDDDAAPRLLPTSTDPFLQSGREVAISPDGAYVVSRAGAGGESALTVLDVADEALRTIELPGEPTDLDLFDAGRRALVMLRDARLAVVVDVPTGELTASVPLPDALGSAAVGEDGGRALLYTTLPAGQLGPRFAVLTLDAETPSLELRPARKEIAGAVLDPGGRVAWVLHRKAEGEPDPTLPEADFLARSHGYSLIDLETLFVRLVTTPAAPGGVLFSVDLARAWVPLSAPETQSYLLQILDLDGLSLRALSLPSAPEALGEVPAADRLFVTQSHPEGRISFLDRDSEAAASDALETLSGYLLNRRIQ